MRQTRLSGLAFPLAIGRFHLRQVILPSLDCPLSLAAASLSRATMGISSVVAVILGLVVAAVVASTGPFPCTYTSSTGLRVRCAPSTLLPLPVLARRRLR